MRFTPTGQKPYIAILCAAYLLILAATTPAILLEKIFATQSGIQLEHLSGTLWHGTVGKVSFPRRIGVAPIQNLQWNFQWHYLFRGELAVNLESADIVGSLTLARGFGGLRIAQADLALPTEDLTQFFPQLGLWQPGGEVQLQTQGFAPNTRTADEINIVWRNATLNLTSLQPLGDYQLQLLNEDGQIKTRLKTLTGKLQLEGVGTFTKDGFQFTGSARAFPAYATQLKPLLDSFGQDRGDGSHIFQLAFH